MEQNYIPPFGARDPEGTPLALRIRCQMCGTSPTFGAWGPVKRLRANI